MKKPERFIIVDDDPLNNSLCKFVLRKVVPEVPVSDFTMPEEALKHIELFYADGATNCKTILFLDINMPLLTGWDFLELYDKLSEHIKSQITVYILSSSVDGSDKEKGALNPYVKEYLVKPLRKETLQDLLTM